jgi:phenylpropionate dioxygenase-like ring-hydroxylating dioxygenase large terminal subunit
MARIVHDDRISNPFMDKSVRGDWFVAALSRDVVPGRLFPTTVLGQDLILWRSSAGIHCWLDLCIHRGAKLSIGSVCGDTVTCAYHGWVYDSGGACIRIPAHPDLKPPAKARTTRFPVYEDHGLIWMSFEPSRPGPALLPTLGAEGRYTWSTGPFEASACGPRLIENFLDVAHLPIVHDGCLGTADKPEIQDYEIEETAEGPVARNIRIFQPNPDGGGVASEVSYDYGILRPLVVYFVKRFAGKTSQTMFFVTPVTQERSRAYFIGCADYDRKTTHEQNQAFSRFIIGQDIPVVESQRPELLPLDLQAELHLRSDRMAIAYRQWLRRENFSFGTS